MQKGAFRSWIWSCGGGVAIGRADGGGWGNLPGHFLSDAGIPALPARGMGCERLDQLALERLYGVRG
jgi:hypothetical protein